MHILRWVESFHSCEELCSINTTHPISQHLLPHLPLPLHHLYFSLSREVTHSLIGIPSNIPTVTFLLTGGSFFTVVIKSCPIKIQNIQPCEFDRLKFLFGIRSTDTHGQPIKLLYNDFVDHDWHHYIKKNGKMLPI